MTPPTSRIALVAPDAWPASVGRTDDEHGVRAGGEDERHAEPRHHERHDELAVGGVGRARSAPSQAIATACSASPATISGREPIRSLRMPAIGATSIGIAVHGSVRSAGLQRAEALRGLEELAEQEDRAEVPKNIANDDAVRGGEAARAEEAQRQHRLRRVRAPTRGTRRAARRRRSALASTVALVQPSASARTMPNVRPNRPAPASARPGRSSALVRAVATRSGGAAASGSSARPIGTLSQKIQCHEMPSTTAPPTSGPSATPRPLTPAQMPSASPRFWRGNASLSSVSVSGRTIAAPRPCRARAAMSASMLGASAAAALASVKSAEADDEHPLAAEAVAERGAGEQQDGERQRVGVDRPLERLDRAAEIGADRRQRDADDEVVERGHEQGDRDDREGPAGAGARGGGHPGRAPSL